MDRDWEDWELMDLFDGFAGDYSWVGWFVKRGEDEVGLCL